MLPLAKWPPLCLLFVLVSSILVHGNSQIALGVPNQFTIRLRVEAASLGEEAIRASIAGSLKNYLQRLEISPAPFLWYFGLETHPERKWGSIPDEMLVPHVEALYPHYSGGSAPGETRDFAFHKHAYKKVGRAMDPRGVVYPDPEELVLRARLGRSYRIRIAAVIEGQHVLDAFWPEPRRTLGSGPIVEMIQPDVLVRLASFHPPEEFGERPYNWTHDVLGIPRAWDFLEANQTKPRGPIIAILDSGADCRNDDLRSTKFWKNREESYVRNGRDSDGNGYPDDRRGWDWTRDCPLSLKDDDTGHGTHCLGIIAAKPKAGSEYRGGICPYAVIMPLKVFSDGGAAPVSKIGQAVDYAQLNGAKIISMSFSTTQDDETFHYALSLAERKALLVASAGNEGVPREQVPLYPASYPCVMGVEAMACDGARANFSNTGYEIHMPGKAVYSTLPGNVRRFWSGTSMAAPAAAAIGGLILTLRPDLGPGEVRHFLERGMAEVDLTGVGSAAAGNGFMNVKAVLEMVKNYNRSTETPWREPDCGFVSLQPRTPLNLVQSVEIDSLDPSRPLTFQIKIVFSPGILDSDTIPLVTMGPEPPFQDYVVTNKTWDGELYVGTIEAGYWMSQGAQVFRIDNLRGQDGSKIPTQLSFSSEFDSDTGPSGLNAESGGPKPDSFIPGEDPFCCRDRVPKNSFNPVIGYRISFSKHREGPYYFWKQMHFPMGERSKVEVPSFLREGTVRGRSLYLKITPLLRNLSGVQFRPVRLTYQPKHQLLAWFFMWKLRHMGR